jgi:HK97 family phage major capsid protein
MSNRLKKLKAARAAGLDKMAALVALVDDEGRDFTDAEQATYTGLASDDDKLAAQIAQEEDLQNRRAAASVPAPSQARGLNSGGASVPAQVAAPLEPGIQFSRITQALIHGDMDKRRASDYAEKTWGTSAAAIVAGMEESTDTKGGFLVDTAYSTDFINLLRPKVVVRRLGGRSIPMPDGNLTTRKKTGNSSASYIGEGDNIATSGMTVGSMTMSAKRLASLVPISNGLLRHASAAVDALVRDDLQETMAVSEDQQFLRGVGSALAPTGILNLAQPANKFPAPAAPTVQDVVNAINKMPYLLAANNIPMTAPGYVISPRLELFLSSLLNSNGVKVYPEMAQGKIGNYPYAMTTSVPDTLGVGGNESEIYFADFAQVAIGDTYRVTIAASDVAAYHDGTQMQSAFSRDETLIRVIQEHDLALRYDLAVAVMQAVTWGA